MTQPRAVTALLLAQDDQSLALDRKVLRALGITHTMFLASGQAALDLIRTQAAKGQSVNGPPAGAGFDIIVCNERLEDMAGITFLSRLRSVPAIADIPAVLLVGNGQSPAAIAARAAGSCAVLARPYSPDQAEEALRAAALPDFRRAPMVLPPSFTDTFSTRRAAANSAPVICRRNSAPRRAPGEAALEQGLAALKRGDFTAADHLLHGSHQADPGRVEACLALSRMYALLHKENEELLWLCRAGILCLKRGEKTRAGNIFSRLPRGKQGQAPLLAEAGLALQNGEAKAAALSFLEAHKLDPSQPLHALIGRTCMFTPAPEEHMHELLRALARAGHDATAGKLHCRLFQQPRQEEEDADGFFSRFPVIGDIISVASHTFKTWRHAV